MGILHGVRKFLKKMGITVVRGDIIAEVREMAAPQLGMNHMPNCKVYPNRTTVLADLPKGGTIAEVGVAYGDFTEVLISELQPDMFIAIDFFALLKKEDEPWGKTELTDNNMTHQQFYEHRFKERLEGDKMELHKGFSWDMLNKFPDEHFDYIYLDADHKYDSVVKDIAALKPKLKKGGYVQFNDYTIIAPSWLDPFGVPKAVHEMLLEGGYEMVALCLEPGGYYDLVCKKL